MIAENMVKCVDVICITPDKEVLILKRGKDAPWMPDKWGLPGGHQDGNENKIVTAKRELYEETGILNNGKFKHFKDIIDFGCFLSYYVTFIKKQEVKLSFEHSEFAWIKKSEIDKYDFVPNADLILKEL